MGYGQACRHAGSVESSLHASLAERGFPSILSVTAKGCRCVPIGCFIAVRIGIAASPTDVYSAEDGDGRGGVLRFVLSVV